MIKNPKAKGTRQEIFVRDILRSFGFTADRNPMSGAIEWLKGDIRSNLPLFFEVKNVEKPHFLEWFKKANDQTQDNPPIIVWTRNNEDTFCFLRFTDMLALLTAKDVSPIAKPEKTKRLGTEETAGLLFSKSYQTRRKAKV